MKVPANPVTTKKAAKKRVASIKVTSSQHELIYLLLAGNAARKIVLDTAKDRYALYEGSYLIQPLHATTCRSLVSAGHVKEDKSASSESSKTFTLLDGFACDESGLLSKGEAKVRIRH